jgi:simple sugar transport system substrate-binding protein
MDRTAIVLRSAAVAALMTAAFSSAVADPLPDKWCANVSIRFFTGGGEGDAFGTIVYNGAKQAASDTGAKVDYLFSKWNSETMIQQLREAIAAKPDGIAMMGHPGNAAILPLAEEAAKAGIRMMYQNVPVDEAAAKFGGGYVGAQQKEQGMALGGEALRRFGLKAGDGAIVISDFAQAERAQRELGIVEVFEAAGMTVIKLQQPEEMKADPNAGIPVITAALAANPTTKVIAYAGGQQLGTAPAYMQAAGKKPGEIINISFDTSPQIIQAFKDGWVQLTADQQPFQQGYLPILSLCQQVVLGLGPVNVDTGAGFVTPENYETVAKLAEQGLR